MIAAGFVVYIVMNCMSRITLSHGIGVHMWNLYYGEYIRMLFVGVTLRKPLTLKLTFFSG